MELYNVEDAMPIGTALGRFVGNGCFQQSPPQSPGIGDAAARKNPRLMLPARMVRIEAVSLQLTQINMSPIAIRQFHWYS